MVFPLNERTNEKEINCIDLIEILPIECYREEWSPAEQS